MLSTHGEPHAFSDELIQDLATAGGKHTWGELRWFDQHLQHCSQCAAVVERLGLNSTTEEADREWDKLLSDTRASLLRKRKKKCA